MAPQILKKRTDSDEILFEKIRCSLQSILANLTAEEVAIITGNEGRSKSSSQPRYSYEEFCHDLNLNDMYSRRILELLVKETLSRRSQRKYVAEDPDDDCLYGMEVEELTGIAWQAWDN